MQLSLVLQDEALVDTAQASSRFRFWHVETLLNTAADLLDRCLIEKAAALAYRAQGAMLNHTHDTEHVKATLDDQRRTTGYYELPSRQNEARLTNAQAQNAKLAEVVAAAKIAHDRTDQGSIQYSTLAEFHRAMSAVMQSQEELFLAQIEVEPSQLENARQIQSVMSAVMRDLEQSALMMNGQCLDYFQLADVVTARVERDFNDATERLYVASVGLIKIYGYDFPFSALYDVSATQYPFRSLDGSVKWVRDAIRWLAAFSQNDQAFTVCHVLNSQNEGWVDFVEGRAPISFRIDESRFSGNSHVRLRGLSLSILDEGTSRQLSFKAKVPRHALIRHATIAEYSHLDQGEIPLCTLGRVASIHSGRDPELCGNVSLMNASPLSDTDLEASWSLEHTVDAAHPLLQTDELLLEMKLTGQPSC